MNWLALRINHNGLGKLCIYGAIIIMRMELSYSSIYILIHLPTRNVIIG